MEEKKRRKESLQKQCLKCKQDEKPSRSSSPVSFPGPSKSVRSTSEPGKYTAMMSIGRQQEEGKLRDHLRQSCHSTWRTTSEIKG